MVALKVVGGPPLSLDPRTAVAPAAIQGPFRPIVVRGRHSADRSG